MKFRSMILAWMVCAIMVLPQTGFSQGALIRKPAQELLEALGKFATGRSGRVLAKELEKVGGEAVVHQLTERALREGGEEALAALVKLTRTHGADVLLAAKNSAELPRVLKAIGELSEMSAAPALRRLASAEGKSLAELTARYGSSVLQAEVRHPGIGGQFFRHLGSDGAELAMKLDTKQAITLARHTEDIAKLAPAQREGVLRLLHNDAEKMVAFMGRWMEKHPGKTLLTAAATTVLLTHSDAILGGGTIAYDSDGRPYFMSRSGLVERILRPILTPILYVLLIGPVIWIGIKLWVTWRAGKAKVAGIEKNIVSSK